MPGTITFKPIEANISHDTSLLGSMSPYCSVALGNNKFNTHICSKSGKHPQWQDSFELSASSKDAILNIELLDKKDELLLMKDSLIGSCSINLKDIEGLGQNRTWFPLYFKDKPAGEILIETNFQGDSFSTQQPLRTPEPVRASEQSLTKESEKSLEKELLTTQNTTFIREEISPIVEPEILVESETIVNKEVPLIPAKTFTEQQQIITPHTFLKTVDVTELVSIPKEMKVMEPRRVLKEVEYTQLVPVKKTYEVVEPEVVLVEVESMEERLVTKKIEVVEHVPVKKLVEIVEMIHKIKNVETWEMQTKKKQIELIEQVAVKKFVEVLEPVHIKKTIELVEPVITTQTIIKEVFEPVIVGEKTTVSVGPATVVAVEGEQTFVREAHLIGADAFKTELKIVEIDADASPARIKKEEISEEGTKKVDLEKMSNPFAVLEDQ